MNSEKLEMVVMWVVLLLCCTNVLLVTYYFVGWWLCFLLLAACGFVGFMIEKAAHEPDTEHPLLNESEDEEKK